MSENNSQNNTGESTQDNSLSGGLLKEALNASEPKEATPESMFDKGGQQETQPKQEEQNKPQEKVEDKVEAPTDYKFEMPEGFVPDEEAVTQFTSFAKELKLPQEKANGLAGIATKLVQKNMARINEAWQKQGKAWEQEIKSDPDFAGENLVSAQRTISKVIKHVPNGKEFVDEIDRLGLGNNPRVFKFLNEIGKRYREDQSIGGQPVQSEKSAAQILYNNTQTRR
jgi:hypothetical protein